MEPSTHNEQQEVEDDALEAGFNDTDLAPVDQENTTIIEEPKPQEAEVKAGEVEAPLTRAEFQAMADRANALEAQLGKVHDKAFGKIGELQQKIEQVRTAGVGLSPRAKERLAEEFPELAEMLFEGAGELGNVAPQIQTPNFDELVESKVSTRQEEMRQSLEKRLLSRDHKDWQQIVVNDGFKGWVSTLPPEDQQQLASTWDADFVSSKITDYKAWMSAQSKAFEVDASKAHEKTKRLEAALTPRGVQRNGPSYDDDDEEAAMAKAFSG